MLRLGVIGKVTFEPSLEGQVGVGHAFIWGKRILGTETASSNDLRWEHAWEQQEGHCG